MSFSGRDINCKELRPRRHLAVAISYPRDAKGKSRPNKRFCDVAETTEVATKNQGRDINNQMGQLIWNPHGGATKLGPKFRTL